MASYNGSSRKGGSFNHSSTMLLSSSPNDQSSADNQALQVNGGNAFTGSLSSSNWESLERTNTLPGVS